EIQVHPAYLELLVPGEPIDAPMSVYGDRFDESLKDSFQFLEDGLFVELGLRLPELVWVPSPDVSEGMIVVRINNRLGLPTLGVQPAELLVNTTLSDLAQRNIPVERPLANPATGYKQAVVADTHKESLEQQGFTTWTPTGLVILILASEIRRAAGQ